jgi:hypothetical protein
MQGAVSVKAGATLIPTRMSYAARVRTDAGEVVEPA